MLTHRHLEHIEALFDLDPVRGYGRRGAVRVVAVVGASGYNLEIGEETHTSEPPPIGPPDLTLPLRAGKDLIGTLHLYGVGQSEQELSLARWAARLLARGLHYASRLGNGGPMRSAEDVQAMLEQTPLTPRERDVVGRLLSGASTRQIAESTGLTIATVNTYLKRIFAKLGVHSRVELVARVTGTRGVIPNVPREDEAQPS